MGNYVRNLGRSQLHPRCRSRARGSIRAAAVSHRPHDSHDSHDSARLPKNVARNSPTPLSNFEIGSLIFRGFQGVIQETRWGITCEIWGGLSGTRGTCGIDGIYGSEGGCKHSRCPVTRGPHPQRCPHCRPPLLKPPKYSHYGRDGLHFGQIASEDHPHQHIATADTTTAAESAHVDRLRTRG